MVIIIATQPSSFRRLRGRSRAADPIRSIWGHRLGNLIQTPKTMISSTASPRSS
jgi:hypothetical protein